MNMHQTLKNMRCAKAEQEGESLGESPVEFIYLGLWHWWKERRLDINHSCLKLHDFFIVSHRNDILKRTGSVVLAGYLIIWPQKCPDTEDGYYLKRMVGTIHFS